MKTVRIIWLCAVVAVVRVSAAGPEPITLRILSYNIRTGIGMDNKHDLARTAAFIKSQNPDLVALSEVDDRTRRSGGINQAMRLGELTGLHAIFGKAMPYNGGYYGEAILSKHPFQEILVHPLPAATNHEPRALVEVQVQIGASGPLVTFYGTHLDHQARDERVKQVAVIQQVATNRMDRFTFLAGDFNDEPGTTPITELLRWWRNAGPDDAQLTWPADKPQERIDFIFYRQHPRLKVVRSEVLNEPVISDHRPVLAVFEIQPE